MKLSDCLKLFAVSIIESCEGNTKKKIIQEIKNKKGKFTIDRMPLGIFRYLKEIDG